MTTAQTFYAGPVKSRQLSPTRRYAPSSRAAVQIREQADTRRVVLDDELARYQRFLQANRGRRQRWASGAERGWIKAWPTSTISQRQRPRAVPDVRVEYEHADGRRDALSTSSDDAALPRHMRPVRLPPGLRASAAARRAPAETNVSEVRCPIRTWPGFLRMTRQQRVEYVALEGFTERQARVPGDRDAPRRRPRAAVTSCVRGHRRMGGVVCEAWQQPRIRSLAAARGLAVSMCTTAACAAIGELLPQPSPQASDAGSSGRTRVLDAARDRETRWLATEQDKLAYFTLTHRIPRQAAVADVSRGGLGDRPHFRTSSHWIHPDAARTRSSRSWQGKRADGLPRVSGTMLNFRSLPAWMVRLVVPAHKAAPSRSTRPPFANSSRRLTAERRGRIPLGMRARRQARQTPTSASTKPSARSAPRFQALIDPGLSVGSVDATQSRRPGRRSQTDGGLECHVLPHQHTHLLPLVGTA